MAFLILAVAASLSMTFLMKYSESHGGNRYALNIWNYLAGTIFSFFLLHDKTVLLVNDHGITIAVSILNGVLYVAGLVSIQLSIVRNGAPLTTTFNKLGVLIPTLMSAFLFAEIPGPIQILGFALAIFAIIYMNGGEKKDQPTFRLGLLFCFLMGGLGDVVSKIYSRNYSGEAQTIFVMYTFFFALLISIYLFVKTKSTMSLQDAVIGICVGVPNQLTAICILRAASELPAYIVYPTYSAGAILFVNIINYLVFKETLTRRQYIATGFIGIALIFLNL